MSKSSLSKLNRTRRIVASGGVAAALLAAAPVGAALAEDEVDVVSEQPADGASAAAEVPPAAAGQEAEAPAAETPDEVPAQMPETRSPSAGPKSRESREAAGDDVDVDFGARTDRDATPRGSAVTGGPSADFGAGGKHRKTGDVFDQLPKGVESAIKASGLSFGDLTPVYAAEDVAFAAPADPALSPLGTRPSGLRGLLSLFGGGGAGEFLLLNQTALLAGALNRRTRQSDDPDAAQWIDSLTDDTPTPAVARFALFSVPEEDGADVDPDNLFLDPGDADAGEAWMNTWWGAPSWTGGTAVNGDPNAAGVSYGLSEDKTKVVIRNDGPAPIAVTTSPGSSAPITGMVILDQGESAEYAATQAQVLGIQGQRIPDAENPDAPGTPVHLGVVVINPERIDDGRALYAGYVSPDTPLVRNRALDAWLGADPGNNFWDPSDGMDELMTGVSGLTPIPGLSYEASEQGLVLTNDSDTEVIVVSTNEDGEKVGDGVYTLPARGTVTVPVVSGGYALLQTPRQDGESVFVGYVVNGGGGYWQGTMPITGQASVDPDNRYFNPGDSDYPGALQNGDFGVKDPAADKVTYRVDGTRLVVENGGDGEIGVLDAVTGGLVTIGAGQEHAFDVPDGGATYLYVQAPRTSDAAAKPVLYGGLMASRHGDEISVGSMQFGANPIRDSNTPEPVDPADTYLDSSDGDYPGALYSGGHRTADPAGKVVYRVEDGTVVVQNTGTSQLGVIDPYGALTLIEAGQEHAFTPSAEGANQTWDYWVQAPRDETTNAPVFYGRLSVAGAGQPNQTVTPVAMRSGQRLIRDSAAPLADPGDRFLDPDDADWAKVSGGWVGADAEAAGVSYERTDNGVVILNDGTEDIAVLAVSSNGAEPELVVIGAGGRHEFAVGEGESRGLYVQGQRDSEGNPVTYGAVSAYRYGGGLMVTSVDLVPADQYPALSASTWIGADPDDRFWTPNDNDPVSPWRQLNYGSGPAAGANPSWDDSAVAADYDPGTGLLTITNNGASDVAVVEFASGLPQSIRVLGEGESMTTTPGTYSAYLVQGERTEDGAANPYGVLRVDGSGGLEKRDYRDAFNRPPTGSVTMDPNDPFTGTITVDDAENGSDVWVNVTQNPDYGYVYLSYDDEGNRIFEYILTEDGVVRAAADGATGDTFVIRVQDRDGASTLIPVTLTFPANEAPVIDSVTMNPSNPYQGTVTATDPDGNPLRYSQGTYPSKGYVNVRADGSFEYVTYAGHDAARDGAGPMTDTFTIRVSDGYGGYTETEPITVTIKPTNQAPTPGYYGTRGYTGNIGARDADYDMLTYSVQQGPSLGSLELDEYGNYTYTPNAGVEHDATNPYLPKFDTFVVLADDGHGGKTPITVNIMFNKQNTAPEFGATSELAEDGTTVITIVTSVAFH